MTTRPKPSKRSQAAERGRQAPQKRAFPVRAALIAAVAVIVVLVAIVFFTNRSGGVPAAAESPGEAVPTMATRQHVQGRVQYTTNPPTSGDHADNPATWGIYNSTPPSDERLVHNLEHGGVIISYNPSQVDEATVEQLKELARDLRGDRTCLILTPRESIQDDKPIALTAWGWLALLDSYDEAAIRAFWRDHVARGPEFGEGRCG